MVPGLPTGLTGAAPRAAAGLERRRLLALAAGLALAGCAGGAPETARPEIAFAPGPPLPLAVSAIGFEEAAPATVEEGRDLRFAMPVSPAATMRRWAAERLRPAGGAGRARVVLTENRFVATPLETASGLEGLFTVEAGARYQGALALRIEIVDDPAGAGFAQAAARAERSALEDDSLARRDDLLFELLQSIAQRLARRLEREIHAHLAPWIAPG